MPPVMIVAGKGPLDWGHMARGLAMHDTTYNLKLCY